MIHNQNLSASTLRLASSKDALYKPCKFHELFFEEDLNLLQTFDKLVLCYLKVGLGPHYSRHTTFGQVFNLVSIAF